MARKDKTTVEASAEPHVKLTATSDGKLAEAVVVRPGVGREQVADLPLDVSAIGLSRPDTELNAARHQAQRARDALELLEVDVATKFAERNFTDIQNVSQRRADARLAAHAAELALAELEVAHYNAHAVVVADNIMKYSGAHEAKLAEQTRINAECDALTAAVGQLHMHLTKIQIRGGRAEDDLSTLSAKSIDDVLNTPLAASGASRWVGE